MRASGSSSHDHVSGSAGYLDIETEPEASDRDCRFQLFPDEFVMHRTSVSSGARSYLQTPSTSTLQTTYIYIGSSSQKMSNKTAHVKTLAMITNSHKHARQKLRMEACVPLVKLVNLSFASIFALFL